MWGHQRHEGIERMMCADVWATHFIQMNSKNKGPDYLWFPSEIGSSVIKMWVGKKMLEI